MFISKDLSYIMKGYAILFIALHNFLHLKEFGLVQENEMRFDICRTYEMFNQILNPSWSLFGHMLSFIGWTGVPVFVFLSGYGLCKKYTNSGGVNLKQYIKHSYLKLFFLMLPGAIVFISYYLFKGEWMIVFQKILAMTMLNNLVPPFITTLGSVAPPYWYFGMTLQLYILFLVVKKYESRKNLLFLTFVIIPILLQLLLVPELVPDQTMLNYIRKNSIGWLPFFYLGVIANSEHVSNMKIEVKVLIPILLISYIMLFMMNLNYILWLFMPLMAIIFFYLLSLFTKEISVVKSIGLWIGSLSPFIFVFHPIVILLYQKTVISEYELPLWILTLIYITITLVGALVFKRIYNTWKI